MKAFLELPICKERYLKNPTTEMIGGKIVNTWNYQSISFACQGNWDSVVFTYEKNEYDFNTAVEDLTKFIKKNS
tara:strand:- start:1755 stop:1976 length:222 start_codon:yes stop_codon:yes gene_type:complete